MSENANTPATVADATLYALQQNGKDVLQSPQRMVSYLIDIASESPSLTVLERNCDHELLEPLVNAVCNSHPTMQGIRLAASRMEDLLVNGRAVAAQPAHQAVEELCRGVVRYLAELSGGAASHVPSPSSTGQTPVQPQPTRPQAEPVPQQNEQAWQPVAPQPMAPQFPQEQQTPLPSISEAPTPSDTTGSFRGPSPVSGTMPVESFPPAQTGSFPQAGSTPQPDVSGSMPQQPETITAPVQSTKPKSKKTLLIVAGIAAAVAIVAGIVVSLNRVTVRFDGGGASGSTHSVKAWRGSEITFPSNSFTRSGYSFVGWELDGETYQPGDTLKPSASTTVEAIWAAEISFDGSGADSGSVDEMLALPGDTITLPSIDFERSDYKANGWLDDNDVLYGEGDEVTVTGPVTYSVSWSARISFEGNGPTSGKTSDVYGDAGGDATIPECGFTYAEHEFQGWATTAGGSVSYSPGDKISGDEPKTLYAVWKLNSKIKDKLDIQATGIDWDSGNHTTMLRVTNNSKAPLKISASFTFKDSSGNTLSTASDTKLYVAPGETTSLDQYCEESGFSSCDYTVTASDPTDGTGPLFGNVSVKEQTVEAAKLVIRITNNGSDTAYIKSFTYYGKGYNGGEAMYYQYPRESIAPGEHIDVTVEASISAEYARWNEYHTREYFLDGYME